MAVEIETIPPELAEMGVRGIALFVIGYCDEDSTLVVEVAMKISGHQPRRVTLDIGRLAVKLFQPRILEISESILPLLRGGDLLIKVDAAFYGEDGE